MAGKGTAALVLGGVAVLMLMPKKKRKKAKKNGVKAPPEDYMSGYFALGATVSAAEGLEKIESVVALRNIIMRDRDGDMHNVASATFHPPSAENPEGVWASDPVFPNNGAQFSGMGPIIGRVVTNFYGPGGRAFEERVMLEFIEGPVAADPRDPDAAPAVVHILLKELRPKIDWTATADGTPARMVLDGAIVIARIVQQQLPERN